MENEICSICRETRCNIVISCNHYFHYNCLNHWLRIRPTCPMCRGRIPIELDEGQIPIELDGELDNELNLDGEFDLDYDSDFSSVRRIDTPLADAIRENIERLDRIARLIVPVVEASSAVETNINVDEEVEPEVIRENTTINIVEDVRNRRGDIRDDRRDDRRGDIRDDIHELREQNNDLRDDLYNLQEARVVEFREENDFLRTNIFDIRNENFDLIQQNLDLRNEKRILRFQVDNKTEEINSLSRMRNIHDREINLQEQITDFYKMKYHIKSIENIELINENIELLNKNLRFQRTIDIYKQYYETTSEYISSTN